MHNRISRLVCNFLFIASLAATNLFWAIFSFSPHHGSCLDAIEHEDKITRSIANDKGIPQTPRVQKYVISLHKQNAAEFSGRNSKSGLRGTTWFPATNGYDQRVLDEWSATTKFRRLNATKFPPNDPKSKFGYENPHHVGCYMTHWNLLRLALDGWKAMKDRPDALVVLEDDASCVQDTMNRTLAIIAQLPEDWDLLYIGGKPFSYHKEDPLPSKWSNITSLSTMPKDAFRKLACQGVFGRSSTGPFAPDGSRNLTLKQPYWRTRYITNTQAYVVNPKRIKRILRVLEQQKEYQVPVDIALADSMKDGYLKAFIPPRELCVQGELPKQKRMNPNPWEGFYYHSQLKGNHWDEIYFSDCPSKP